MARHRVTPGCPSFVICCCNDVPIFNYLSGKRLARFARGDGIVDKPLLMARGVPPLRHHEPAILLDAAGTGGFAGVRLLPFHLPQAVAERAGGAERSAV